MLKHCFSAVQDLAACCARVGVVLGAAFIAHAVAERSYYLSHTQRPHDLVCAGRLFDKMSTHGLSSPEAKDSTNWPPTSNLARYQDASGSTLGSINDLEQPDSTGLHHRYESYNATLMKYEPSFPDSLDSQQDLLASARQSRVLYHSKGATRRFENLGQFIGAHTCCRTLIT